MLSVTIQVKNMKELAVLAGNLAVLGTTGEVSEVSQAPSTKAAAPAGKKAAAPAAPTEPEVDLGFDTATEAAAPAITLEDVIKGFKEFAAKNDREKAGKILGKFGVKSVRDLKETDFEKVMKALGK